MISIKICDVSIGKYLEFIFRSWKNGKFPNEWKKANVVPAHKKGSFLLLEKYLKKYCITTCMNTLQKID